MYIVHVTPCGVLRFRASAVASGGGGSEGGHHREIMPYVPLLRIQIVVLTPSCIAYENYEDFIEY